MTADATTYRELADAAWRWVLEQVRWDDGPWIPESVPSAKESVTAEVPEHRDGMHSGTGGLAHVLSEIRLSRPWTAEEELLATAIADRIRAGIPDSTDYTYFDGLVSDLGVLTALKAPGSAEALERLKDLATADGWPQPFVVPPRFLPDARLNDLTLGTAGVLLGAVWAQRNGLTDTRELADHAAAVLLAEAVEVPTGTDWPFVPERFCTKPGTQMPNLSHGVAGIAATLAAAGAELDRPDLISAARSGAEHLVALGLVTRGKGDGDSFVVPRYIPSEGLDEDEFTYTWCHGASGTSLLFAALDHAGVAEVAGEPPLTWHRRCLNSVRTSGLPERLHPGFWDNDGRCCGTAGVGDIFLDSWHWSGEGEDLEFALRLADALVDHAVRDGERAYWQFVEHRNPDPLLPPGVGWMQGAAGIAAFLFRISRVLTDGHAAEVVPRMDTWWAVGRP